MYFQCIGCFATIMYKRVWNQCSSGQVWTSIFSTGQDTTTEHYLADEFKRTCLLVKVQQELLCVSP